MISSVTGTVTAVSPGRCVIDVRGIGYLVSVPDHFSTATAVAETVTVYTSLVVREDSLSLFGFGTVEEQELFDALTSVSGVGPRSALGILSEMTPAQVISAVAAEDDSPFRKVSGIGPKTAKLITVQLSGRLPHLSLSDSFAARQGRSSNPSELTELVVAALTQLGWNERRARETVTSLEPFSDQDSTESVLKRALAEMGGRGQ